MNSGSIIRIVEKGIQNQDMEVIIESISKIRFKDVDNVVKDLHAEYIISLLEMMVDQLIENANNREMLLIRWINSLIKSYYNHEPSVRKGNYSETLIRLRQFLDSRAKVLDDLHRLGGQITFVNSTLEKNSLFQKFPHNPTVPHLEHLSDIFDDEPKKAKRAKR